MVYEPSCICATEQFADTSVPILGAECTWSMYFIPSYVCISMSTPHTLQWITLFSVHWSVSYA